MKNTYQPQGRKANSFLSYFNAKAGFRVLGFFFAAVATLANAADAFNIAQTIVIPFFFTGIDMGVGLIAFSIIAAVAISILYIYQEGISVVKGTEELPTNFNEFLERWRKKGQKPFASEPETKLTFRQRMACSVVSLVTGSIAVSVSIFWSLSVFAGVVALAAAMGFGPTTVVLTVAALTGAAQFSACYFQEGSNFKKRVQGTLARYLKVSEFVEIHKRVGAQLNLSPVPRDSALRLTRSLSDSQLQSRVDKAPSLAVFSKTGGERGLFTVTPRRLSLSTADSEQASTSTAFSPPNGDDEAAVLLASRA